MLEDIHAGDTEFHLIRLSSRIAGELIHDSQYRITLHLETPHWWILGGSDGADGVDIRVA